MSRFHVLTDEQWERIEPLLPSNVGKVGRSFGDHRTVVEGIACRYRTDKRRNVVERSFNLLNQWRGLATRYDKHAVVYRAGAVLAAVVTWLRAGPFRESA